jgi:hypothetical protein
MNRSVVLFMLAMGMPLWAAHAADDVNKILDQVEAKRRRRMSAWLCTW